MDQSSRVVVSLLAALVLATHADSRDRGSRGSNSGSAQVQSRPSPSPSPAPSRPASAASSPSSGGSRPSGGSSFGSAGGSRGYTPAPAPSQPGRGSYTPPAPAPSRPAPAPSTPSSGYDRGSYDRGGSSRAPSREPAPVDFGGGGRDSGNSGSSGDVRWRTGDSAPTRDSTTTREAQPRRESGASRTSTSGAFENPARTDGTGWGAGSGRDARGVSSAPDEASPRYLPRVWDSDQAVWRTKPQPAPVPRVSSGARAEGDASLSRARLERANGAPLVGGDGARAGAAPAAARAGLQPVALDRQGLIERYARAEAKDAPVKPIGQRGAADAAEPRATRAAAAGTAAEASLSTRRGARARAAEEAHAQGGGRRLEPAAEAGRKRVETAPSRTSGKEAAESEPSRKRSETVQRTAVKRLDELRRTDPEGARRLERTSAEVAVATHTASRVTLGVAVGAWTGCNTGWWWPAYDKSCGWYQPWWWWNSSWSHCWSWNVGWNSCHGWYGGIGWSSGWYGSSCYRYDPWCTPAWCWYPSVVWCNDPVVVERIVEREVVVEREVPVAAGEGVVAAGAEPSPAQEIVDALQVAARKHLDEGDAAFREGRYADAVHHYARALECSPQDAGLHLVLADALFATGDYHYCAWSLRRAVELDPAVLDVDVDKHAFYADPAEFDRQLALAEGFLEDHFLDDDARLVLAFNYHCAKRHAEAVTLLESAFSSAVLDTPAGAKVHARAAAAATQGR